MDEQKLYIGCKLIKAVPMMQIDFEKERYGCLSELPPKATNEPGYKVTYPDGYVSWSPKAVFENAYREVTETELRFVGIPTQDQTNK